MMMVISVTAVFQDTRGPFTVEIVTVEIVTVQVVTVVVAVGSRDGSGQLTQCTNVKGIEGWYSC